MQNAGSGEFVEIFLASQKPFLWTLKDTKNYQYAIKKGFHWCCIGPWKGPYTTALGFWTKSMLKQRSRSKGKIFKNVQVLDEKVTFVESLYYITYLLDSNKE